MGIGGFEVRKGDKNTTSTVLCCFFWWRPFKFQMAWKIEHGHSMGIMVLVSRTSSCQYVICYMWLFYVVLHGP